MLRTDFTSLLRLRRSPVIAVLALLLILVAPTVSGAAPAGGDERAPRIDSKSWILVDQRDGAVLTGSRVDRRLPMASTTKLMTAYLAIRRLPPGQIVTAPAYASDPVESLMGLVEGQRVSVRDLLLGLILLSGNDAAVALAEAVSGSVPAFVGLMNRTARRLGLDDTSYENPIGLDGPDHYSTAEDLAKLSRILMKIPRFARIAGLREALLTSYRPPLEIVSTNDFLLANEWATGIKTGATTRAGYLLTSAGTRKGADLIGVVVGADSEAARDSETVELMEFGFSRYEERRPLRRGTSEASVPVRFRSGTELALTPARSVVVGVRRGQKLAQRLELPREVEGPIRKGERVGSAIVLLDGQKVARVGLLARSSVSAPTTLERVRGFLTGNLVLVLLGVFAIMVLALAYRRSRTRKARNKLRRLGRRQS
jgi:D-alanyl-D-alanine carboxypeptidase (penicillin-binding protein 5/6)